MTSPGPASVVIVTHNSAGIVEPVLDALFADPIQPDEVIVVDSASEDGTLDLLAGYAVKVIASAENVGFAAGCHLGASAASNDVLMFLGHDTRPTPGWLAPMVAALEEPGVGAAMCTVEDSVHPGTFNTSGGRLTYFGIAWVSDLGKPIPAEEDLIDIAFPQGGAMAIRRETWERFGGFRPEFFMYDEDVDLGWRIRLAGLRIVRVPGSVVAHEYDFGRSPRKMYHLERNRWLMLRSNYRRRTLFVLSPALFLVEIGTTVVSIRDGWWADKRAAWKDAAGAGEWIRTGRCLANANRKLGDADMISGMDFRLSDISQVRTPLLTIFADFLLGLWKISVTPVVRLLDRLP